MAARLDKRGRKIGRNWWREYNMAALDAAEMHWQQGRESGDPIHSDAVAGADYDTAFNQLSDDEYRLVRARPTLKEFLCANKGMGVDPETA